LRPSYEEIRDIVFDLLAGRERGSYDLNQYGNLEIGVAEVLRNRGGTVVKSMGGKTQLSDVDHATYQEVFWALFREGIITIGRDRLNREFPFFRVTKKGEGMLGGGRPYYFHDVSTFERVIKTEVPAIDDVTLVYLLESMQAFKSGCLLSASVMLGVATEHTFLLLLDAIRANVNVAKIIAKVDKERSILPKVNAFKGVLETHVKRLPSAFREDLDTQFLGILSIIRTFRNESGHPTGKIIDREQAYVLLHLFVPYCKKMYQLREFFDAETTPW